MNTISGRTVSGGTGGQARKLESLFVLPSSLFDVCEHQTGDEDILVHQLSDFLCCFFPFLDHRGGGCGAESAAAAPRINRSGPPERDSSVEDTLQLSSVASTPKGYLPQEACKRGLEAFRPVWRIAEIGQTSP